MKKAQQKLEYRRDDFLADRKAGNVPEDEEYEPVVNFDQRFYYYDVYVDTADELPETSTREAEEAKISIWELEGLELELSMALDPESFAAKVLNPKKRKLDPETTGSGLPQNPTAKRKPDGSTETSRGLSISKTGTNANGSGYTVRLSRKVHTRHLHRGSAPSNNTRSSVSRRGGWPELSREWPHLLMGDRGIRNFRLLNGLAIEACPALFPCNIRSDLATAWAWLKTLP